MSKSSGLFGAAILATIFAGLPLMVVGQTRIDNPRRALAKNAGRVVKLKEVLRIRDDGDRVIFKVPQKLALGADGSLYFQDIAEGDRVYRFGPDGGFVFKTLKTGQGPGECLHARNFLLDGERMRVQSWSPPKVMDFGLDGRYRSEIATASTKGLHCLFLIDGRIYGLCDELAQMERIDQVGTFAIPYALYEIPADFGRWTKLADFPVRVSVRRNKSSGPSWVRLDMIEAAAGGPFICVVHSAEYRIDQFDLRTGRVERVFARPYDRRRLKAEGDEDLDTGEKREPDTSDDLAFDVLELHAVGDRLWAFTSTMTDRGNDRQVDVFDAGGRYVDSFVLDFPDRGLRHTYTKSLVTADGFYFVAEQDRDGLVSIGKYRVEDSDLFPVQPGSKRAP
jgi:hypothetical protein